MCLILLLNFFPPTSFVPQWVAANSSKFLTDLCTVLPSRSSCGLLCFTFLYASSKPLRQLFEIEDIPYRPSCEVWRSDGQTDPIVAAVLPVPIGCMPSGFEKDKSSPWILGSLFEDSAKGSQGKTNRKFLCCQKAETRLHSFFLFRFAKELWHAMTFDQCLRAAY